MPDMRADRACREVVFEEKRVWVSIAYFDEQRGIV
jgi:hypothetical protein